MVDPMTTKLEHKKIIRSLCRINFIVDDFNMFLMHDHKPEYVGRKFGFKVGCTLFILTRCELYLG